jgi:maltodextrin utilization protein YvdJ
MSVKEEIIEKAMLIRDSRKDRKRYVKIKEDADTEKGVSKKLKRKYRTMLTLLLFLSIILIFMILPMVIAAFTQNLGG